MNKYYLAVDIGASSGRHILGICENGRIALEEVYRFQNGMKDDGGSLCWDTGLLFEEIKNGLKKCKEIDKIPCCMAIDTWAVDYVLLDGDDRILGKTYGYRDGRTKGMDDKVYEKISQEALYGRSGIQKQIFNTVYQLMAVKELEPGCLERAESLLMIPDYFTYLLTGVKKTEYTNATTTQLVSPETKDWDWELIDRLEYPRRIFGEISPPGTAAGSFAESVRREIGFDCRVLLTASHDTASAVAAVPAKEEKPLYISSGTWSLLGTELKEADCSAGSMEKNFTNEGGFDYRYRYLKNIMGLWMIQSVKKELEEDYSFARLCGLAAAEDITSVVDCNDDSFLAPESMIRAVRDYCVRTGQQVPCTAGELAAVIYHSLAECYKKAVRELEELTGKTYPRIYIVGGGSNAEYLNELTAKATKKEICAGPSEATAVGNLLIQMIADHVFSGLKEARASVRRSMDIKIICENEMNDGGEIDYDDERAV